MGVTKFELVRSLVVNLQNPEFKELTKQISILPNSTTSSRRLRIVKYLREKVPSESDFKKKFSLLYPRKINTELESILRISRDSVISDAVLIKTLENSPIFLEKFNLLKDIPFVMIARKNGCIELSEHIIDNNIAKADRNEMFEELCTYLQMKLDISYYNTKAESLSNIQELLKKAESKSKLLKSTIQSYENYMANALTKSNSDLNTSSLNTLKLIEANYSKTKSRRIEQYLYLIEMERAIVLQNYELGLEAGIRHLDLIYKVKHLYSENRVLSALSYLAHNQLCCLDLSNSLKILEYGHHMIRVNSIYAFVFGEFEVKSNILLGRLKISQKLLNEILSRPTLSSFPFYESKFKYYQAILFFLEKDFNAAWKILSQHLELEKDKEGWRVWLSIMRIICQIERQDLVDLDMQIQSFRKYIKRWEQRSEIRERDKLVFRVLESLNRHQLDFHKVAEEEDELLTVLAYPKGDLKWEPNSPELIMFHEWFKSKLKNIPYKPDFEPYKHVKTGRQSDEYLADIERVMHLEQKE